MHASGEGEVCLDADNRGAFGVSLPSAASFDHLPLAAKGISHCPSRSEARSGPEIARNLANVGLRLHLVSSPNWFSDTLPGFLAANPGPVSLLHLDCDTYEATAEVLGMIMERLTPKTIIIMDDYHGFWGYRDGQFRAWAEFVVAYGLVYRYAAFNRHAVVVCNIQSEAPEPPREQAVPQ